MKAFTIIVLFLLVSCAQQAPLTGGQKDVSPPQLDSLKTHPLSLATFFNENEVKLISKNLKKYCDVLMVLLSGHSSIKLLVL